MGGRSLAATPRSLVTAAVTGEAPSSSSGGSCRRDCGDRRPGRDRFACCHTGSVAGTTAHSHRRPLHVTANNDTPDKQQRKQAQ
ncbi:hypothetical protein MRX96_002119 [Rhipicephalus microplus]